MILSAFFDVLKILQSPGVRGENDGKPIGNGHYRFHKRSQCFRLIDVRGTMQSERGILPLTEALRQRMRQRAILLPDQRVDHSIADEVNLFGRDALGEKILIRWPLSREKGIGNGIGAQKIGDLENNWNLAVQSAASTGTTSDGSPFPPAAASAIRIYNRYFDLRTLAGF